LPLLSLSILIITIPLAAWLSPTAVGESPVQATPASKVRIRGALEMVYAEGRNNTAETRYYLALPNGTRVTLLFTSKPSFSLFAKQVDVTGSPPTKTRLPNNRNETRMQVEDVTLAITETQPSVAQAPVTGTKKIILLLLKYSDDTSVPRDPSYYDALMNPATGNTVNAFYQANSWGLFGIQADHTTSWLTLPNPKSYYANCGFSSVCADTTALFNDGTSLGNSNGVNFANYDIISLVLSNDLDCCAWGGSHYATLNGVTKSWPTTWMPPWAQEVGTYSHEIGHSLGLPHSGWVYYDYDSPWDVMSNGYNFSPTACGSYYSRNSGGTRTLYCYTPADTIAPYKDILGWIDPSHLLTIPAGATGTASLDSLASGLASPYKMVRICITGYSCTTGGTTSRYLTIEVRTHYGYDANLPAEGVIIHKFQGDRPTISGTCYFISDNPPAYPVDSTPGDYNSDTCSGTGLYNAQWAVGQTYSDPSILGANQIRITGESGVSPNPVTFTISISPPTFSVTITSNPAGLGFLTVDATSVATPQTFNWTDGSTHTLAANSPVSGAPGVRYVWTSWSDGGAQSHTVTASPGTTTYTATFKTQYQLTIAASPASAGSTSPTAGPYWYDSGSSVPVSATASLGYSFYYWDLDGTNVGSSPSYSVSMLAPHALTAFYRGTSTISLLLSSNSISLGDSVQVSGSISPVQPSPGVPTGTTIALSLSTDGGATWSYLLSMQTDSTEGYAITWHPPYAGNLQLKASWNGNSNYEGASSSTVILSVTGAGTSRALLVVSGASSAARGSTATFDIVIDNSGTSFTISLFIEVMGPSGYLYFDTLQVTVNGSGLSRFQLNWQVPSSAATGAYQVTIGLIPPRPTSVSQTQITVT
jgi:M6 family metalloprotease-like protein